MTLKKLTEYYREIINRVGVCLDVKNDFPQEYEILTELLLNWHDRKKAEGMINLRVLENYLNRKAYHLVIVKEDGEEDTISWKDCVINKNRGKLFKQDTDMKDLVATMRECISPQVINFKRSFNNDFTCVNCTAKGNDSQIFEVDHVITFKELKDSFLKTQVDYPKEFEWIRKPHWRIARPFFKADDIEFRDEWIKYHENNCQLRILCKKCNMGRNRTGCDY